MTNNDHRIRARDADAPATPTVTVTQMLVDDASRAVASRIAALRRWEARNPQARHRQEDLLAAAAVAPLIALGDEPGFDDVTFGDLADFVAEIPW
ncbi:hypothetical protein [Sphingomonas immobilis]|uniref:Uncharacterized protein n=1 Tax=Sphingomonas immobilis TaxID=3063997 RepID=A0ABT8ZXR8_9SPHN|nr:hypothetical protein [Sphingomonas sp. CA1-15]MDO7841924.1 hypothetical protein [Sphingomonas sp. CA1-15]